MKKLLPSLSFCSILFIAAAQPVQAQAFDVNQLRCGELMEQDQDTVATMLLWMDGYLSGVTGDTRFNPDGLETFAEQIGEACAKSPDTKVLDVAKIVGIQ
jgi:acid stress chaperone HdeB